MNHHHLVTRAQMLAYDRVGSVPNALPIVSVHRDPLGNPSHDGNVLVWCDSSRFQNPDSITHRINMPDQSAEACEASSRSDQDQTSLTGRTPVRPSSLTCTNSESSQTEGQICAPMSLTSDNGYMERAS